MAVEAPPTIEDRIQYLQERLESADAAIQTLHDALFTPMEPATTPGVESAVALDRLDWIEDQVTAETVQRQTDVIRVEHQVANHVHPVATYEHDHEHIHDEYAISGHSHSALTEALGLQGGQLAKLRADTDGVALKLRTAEQGLIANIVELQTQVGGLMDHGHADIDTALGDIVDNLTSRGEKHNQLVDEFLALQQTVKDHGLRLVALQGELESVRMVVGEQGAELGRHSHPSPAHTHKDDLAEKAEKNHEHAPAPTHAHEYASDGKPNAAGFQAWACTVPGCTFRYFIKGT